MQLLLLCSTSLKYAGGRTDQASSQPGLLEPLAMPLARTGPHCPCLVGRDCRVCSNHTCLLFAREQDNISITYCKAGDQGELKGNRAHLAPC